MKTLRLFLLVAITSFMVACSSGGSFNKKACEDLKEKLTQGETLSQSDYQTMIEQFVGAADELKTQTDKLPEDVNARAQAVADSPELIELTGYVLGFGIYLDQHKDDLDDSNQKRYEEAVKHIDEMK